MLNYSSEISQALLKTTDKRFSRDGFIQNGQKMCRREIKDQALSLAGLVNAKEHTDMD